MKSFTFLNYEITIKKIKNKKKFKPLNSANRKIDLDENLIYMLHINGMKNTEIAEKLNVSEWTIRDRIKKYKIKKGEMR